MQTTYRLKAQEISMTFLKSLKTMFAGQEVEITIKSIEPREENIHTDNKKLLDMIRESRRNAPLISQDVDIRGLIDESQYPDQ